MKKKAKRPVAKKTKAVVKGKVAATKKASKTPSRAAVVNRIREVIVPLATKDQPVLVTPLPQKEVRNFGEIPFEHQANLVFQTFPADAAEIIGSTKNSGPANAKTPPVSAG
jgi:hypothetical protein